MSALEASVNVMVGYVVALGATAVVLPAFGHGVGLSDTLGISAVFTAISLVRSYAIRRIFNWVV